MTRRSLRDELRGAFEAMTRPHRPEMAARIKEGIIAGRRPRRHLLTPSLGIAALAALLIAGGTALAASLVPVPRLVGRTPSVAPTARATPPPTPAETPAATPTPAAVPTATPSPTAAPTQVALPGCAATSGGGGGHGAVTDVRMAAHPGYDRFVMQFAGPVPQYEVRPQVGATFDAVTLDGSAGILIVLHDASAAGSYGGPTDFRPGYPALREARQLGDGNGVVEWGLGLARPTCYQLQTLPNPSRLVVDVQY
jgi:hypothetical protein